MLPNHAADVSPFMLHEQSSYSQVMLQAYFRPELLNRLDETIVFRQLSRHNVRQIADLVLADTASQLAKQNIQLKVSPAVMSKIVDEGYDEVCGFASVVLHAAALYLSKGCEISEAC